MHLLLFLSRGFLVCKDLFINTPNNRGKVFLKAIAVIGMVAIAAIIIACCWFVLSILINAFSDGLITGFIVFMIIVTLFSF